MTPMKRIALLLVLLAATLCAQQPVSTTVTIAAGASLSGAVNLAACTPIRIIAGAAASGWTTANLTFQVSHDGATYGNFRDQYGTEISATVVTAGDVIQLDGGTFTSMRYIKVRSGTTGTPVNQASDQVVTIICKTY